MGGAEDGTAICRNPPRSPLPACTDITESAAAPPMVCGASREAPRTANLLSMSLVAVGASNLGKTAPRIQNSAGDESANCLCGTRRTRQAIRILQQMQHCLRAVSTCLDYPKLVQAPTCLSTQPSNLQRKWQPFAAYRAVQQPYAVAKSANNNHLQTTRCKQRPPRTGGGSGSGSGGHCRFASPVLHCSLTCCVPRHAAHLSHTKPASPSRTHHRSTPPRCPAAPPASL